MPRRKTPQASAPVIPSNSLVASAVRYSGNSTRIYQGAKGWQTEAYRHFNICGEARYAATYMGHALSRCTLYAADYVKDVLVRLPDANVASQALDVLFNGPKGQSQMLYQIGVHLTVAGECFLVGRSGAQAERDIADTNSVMPGKDIWEIVSVKEMNVSGAEWTIKYDDQRMPVRLTDSDVVIRFWRPHPEKRIDADSPFRSLLPVLTEIEYLTMHIFAQTRSRLAGAGLLILSQGMTFPAPPDQDGEQVTTLNEAEQFILTLADAMMKPIEEPSSPSATVPLVVTAPEAVMGKAAELVHFWSELDSASVEMRKDALHRFALGMDLPPEMILGMGSNPGTGGGTSNGVSHWGAWQIEESTIKMHIEPLLELVTNSLTLSYLRPAIEYASETVVIDYDTVKLRLRPDRSKEALELWDRGVLNEKALMREVGFDEADIQNADERREWLLRKVAGGSATPEQVQVALRLLGADLGELSRPDEQPREARPVPSLEEHPTKELPEAASTVALVAAADALCFRALERAGNRLRQGIAKPPTCPSYLTHTLVKTNGNAEFCLQDAFTGSADEIIAGAGGDPVKVVPVLESYVSTLLAEQSPHERERMAEWLHRGALT